MVSVGAMLVAFAVSVLTTPLVIRLAPKFGFVSRPKAERWNLRPIPLMGGIALYLAVTGAVLLFGTLTRELIGVLIGGTFIFALGLIDDIVQIKPSSKFLGEIMAVCVVLYAGLGFDLIPNPFLNLFLTVLWVVGITNAFNLLDNMDGLSAGVAAISSLTTFIFSLIQGLPEISVLSLAVLGACLGFLLFNFNPARIFMGDCGSLFLGFTLACTTVLGSWEQASNLFAILAIPSLALGVPIFDTLLVTVSRAVSGRSISVGGRDHTSHRLVALGMSERRAVVSLYGLCAALGGIAIVSVVFNLVVSGLMTVFSIIILALFGLYLGQKKVYRYASEESPGGEERGEGGFYSTFIRHKLRILEVTIDIGLISLAFVSAYALRFDGGIPPAYHHQIAMTLPALLAVKLSLFYYFGLYRIVWPYMDVSDLTSISKAVVSGSVVSVLGLVAVTNFDGYSRVVFVLDGFLLLALVAGSRMLFRLFHEYFAGLSPRRGRRLLIVGAGDAGVMILREIRNNPDLPYLPVGFIDDDRGKAGKRIHGLPVFGGRETIPSITRKEAVDEILIAIPSLPDAERRHIIAVCEGTGTHYRVMQSLAKSIWG